MRILVLGKNYSALKFYENFSEIEENIVFSIIPNCKNYIEFENTDDIIEFCVENLINLVLIIDENYINEGLAEFLNSKNITAFCPSSEAITITTCKTHAKRFMYKNKIKTSKFMILDKNTTALDYIKNVTYPITVKPEENSFCEGPIFCETQNQATKAINKLFDTGSKKIIIEDYIEGKNVCLWAITDGYSAKILFSNAKYQNNISYFEPNFLNIETKEKMLQEVILPTIQALNEQDEEYIGILGFDFILTRENDFHLVGYNNFFDDLSIDFALNCFNFNWAEVFDSCIVGDIFLKHDFSLKSQKMLTIRDMEEINFIKANTTNNLNLYLKELEINTNEYEEAKKLWKY